MSWALRWELFATGTASPEDTWALVSDLSRLPEWTDADAVEPPLGPLEVGAEFFVSVAGRRLLWRLTTVEPRLLEATTDVPRGRLGIGVRVAADPRGTRLVLAGGLDGDGAAARWRARLVDVPAMRRRFDRWTAAALQRAHG